MKAKKSKVLDKYLEISINDEVYEEMLKVVEE